MKKALLVSVFFIVLFCPALSFSSVDEFTPLVDVSIEACDEGDGTGLFDLESTVDDILGDDDSSDFDVSFHLSQADADQNINEIDTSVFFNGTNQTLFARVSPMPDDSDDSDDSDNSEDFEVSEVSLIVNENPIVIFSSDVVYEVCPNNTTPITIQSEFSNYDRGKVTTKWFKDGVELEGETISRIEVVDAAFYELEITVNRTGCVGRNGVEVREVQNCIVPQGISPNGDGMNDSLDLTDFRVTSIQIFNRYGTQVFSQSNYTNEWNGQNENGEDLPVGTYYYTLVFKEGQRTSGWVYIQRSK